MNVPHSLLSVCLCINATLISLKNNLEFAARSHHIMAHQGEYCNWPFLNQEEFELACAFFDQRYVRAKLGPTRNIFKVKTRRTLTTGSTYLEILRLLQLPEDKDDLALAFSRTRIGGIDPSDFSGDIDMANEDRDQVSGASGLSSPVCLPANQTKEILRSRPEAQAGDGEALPQYSIYSHQPYVIYEVHLHPTYNVPTLWFVLHDLPMGEQTFDIESIYRYLVPPQFKSQMRQFGPVGGISAAVSILQSQIRSRLRILNLATSID